jgi:hypothetical protein
MKTNNLFNDLSETQSEAINGGFFDLNVTVKKRSIVFVDQSSGSAVVGIVGGNATALSGNAVFVFSSVS